MDIKRLLQLGIILPVLMISGFQCSGDSKLLEQVPDSEFIENCSDELYEFGEMVSLGDPNGTFFIQIPYSWDTRESYTDSVYGIFSSNFLSIPKPVEEMMALSVSGYASEKSMEEYFNSEVIELVKEEKIEVKEKGKVMLFGEKFPWILFKMYDGSYNMVYYVKSPEINNYYLIQTATYDSVNYKGKLCYLKQLVKTFEFDSN